MFNDAIVYTTVCNYSRMHAQSLERMRVAVI